MGNAQGKPRSGRNMSPLGLLLMKLMRGGALASGGFVALVIGLEVWKHGGDMTALDPGFMAVLALMLAGAWWLARAIARELAKPGSGHGS